jgi:hypothetical protein
MERSAANSEEQPVPRIYRPEDDAVACGGEYSSEEGGSRWRDFDHQFFFFEKIWEHDEQLDGHGQKNGTATPTRGSWPPSS